MFKYFSCSRAFECVGIHEGAWLPGGQVPASPGGGPQPEGRQGGHQYHIISLSCFKTLRDKQGFLPKKLLWIRSNDIIFMFCVMKDFEMFITSLLLLLYCCLTVLVTWWVLSSVVDCVSHTLLAALAATQPGRQWGLKMQVRGTELGTRIIIRVNVSLRH